jgi:hypothetical protein
VEGCVAQEALAAGHDRVALDHAAHAEPLGAGKAFDRRQHQAAAAGAGGDGSLIPSVEDRLLHGDKQVARAQLQLHGILRDLLIEAADAHDIRDDVGPVELATYCLHALTPAGSLPTKAAVGRVVNVTLAGLRP